MENDIIDNLANKVKILTHQLTNANLKIEKLEEKLYEQETNYDFSYQIDKNTFIRCIKALEQYSKFSNDIYGLLKLNTGDIKELEELVWCIEDLLEKCCNDDHKDDKSYVPDISYFMWNLDFGNKYSPGDIIDKDGVNLDFSSVEKLWEYIYEDKITKYKQSNGDWIRRMDDEDLADYINAVYITGQMVAKGHIDKEDVMNYEDWIKEEHKEN